MKKVALFLAFVFMFGTIAVNAQTPKSDVKKKPAIEKKKLVVKKEDKKVAPAKIKKAAPKKNVHKKRVKKVAKPAETTPTTAQ
jgi:hypothetical protein